jgi:hypothetical protein
VGVQERDGHCNVPIGPRPPLSRLHDHTQTLSTRLDARGRVISPTQRLVTDNAQHSQETETSMPLVGFEPAIPASERPKTHAIDRAVTGIGVESIVSDVKHQIFALDFHRHFTVVNRSKVFVNRTVVLLVSSELGHIMRDSASGKRGKSARL